MPYHRQALSLSLSENAAHGLSRDQAVNLDLVYTFPGQQLDGRTPLLLGRNLQMIRVVSGSIDGGANQQDVRADTIAARNLGLPTMEGFQVAAHVTDRRHAMLNEYREGLGVILIFSKVDVHVPKPGNGKQSCSRKAASCVRNQIRGGRKHSLNPTVMNPYISLERVSPGPID